MDDWSNRVWKEHNKIRSDYHLPPVQWDARLCQHAEDHCRQMMDDGKLFHDDYTYLQNVLWGKKNFIRNAEKCVDVWLQDEGHKRPIIDPKVTMIGAAYSLNPSTNDTFITCNYE